jgi:hypothetical protein
MVKSANAAAARSENRVPPRRLRRGGVGRGIDRIAARVVAVCVTRGRRACRRRRAGRCPRDLRHLGVEQVAAAGDEPDQAAVVVAERGAELANALEEAVFGDVDIGPHRLHQLRLAQHAPGAGHEKC